MNWQFHANPTLTLIVWFVGVETHLMWKHFHFQLAMRQKKNVFVFVRQSSGCERQLTLTVVHDDVKIEEVWVKWTGTPPPTLLPTKWFQSQLQRDFRVLSNQQKKILMVA